MHGVLGICWFYVLVELRGLGCDLDGFSGYGTDAGYPTRPLWVVRGVLLFNCPTHAPRRRHPAAHPPTSHNDKLLQLAIGRLDRLLLVLGLLAGQLLTAGPVHRAQALRQNGVRVVERRVEPVSVHGREVLDLQLEQRRAQLHAVAQINGEGI